LIETVLFKRIKKNLIYRYLVSAGIIVNLYYIVNDGYRVKKEAIKENE
jgi:hypothetical protein